MLKKILIFSLLLLGFDALGSDWEDQMECWANLHAFDGSVERAKDILHFTENNNKAGILNIKFPNHYELLIWALKLDDTPDFFDSVNLIVTLNDASQEKIRTVGKNNFNSNSMIVHSLKFVEEQTKHWDSFRGFSELTYNTDAYTIAAQAGIPHETDYAYRRGLIPPKMPKSVYLHCLLLKKDIPDKGKIRQAFEDKISHIKL